MEKRKTGTKTTEKEGKFEASKNIKGFERQ